jgi:hypothetical protein
MLVEENPRAEQILAGYRPERRVLGNWFEAGRSWQLSTPAGGFPGAGPGSCPNDERDGAAVHAIGRVSGQPPQHLELIEWRGILAPPYWAISNSCLMTTGTERVL